MNIPSASIYRDLCPLNQGPTMVGTFIDYCMSFYGKGEICDIGATEKMIENALGIRLKRYADIPFDGDSVDREFIRDIIIEQGNK